MAKIIVFDMDGTIANTYGVENWLEKLRAYDPSPYAEAEPLWDMEALRAVVNLLRVNGWEIRISTWLSKESTPEYDEEVRKAKRDWLARHNFPYDHFHGVQYGTTKASTVRKYADYAILIDDNATVRKGWTLGDTIDPTSCNLIEELTHLLW